MKCSPISSFFVLSMVFMFRLIDTATVFEAEENKNNFSMASLAYMYHFKGKCTYFLPYVRLNICHVKKLVLLLFFLILNLQFLQFLNISF